MTNQTPKPLAAVVFRHAKSRDELAACYPVIVELRSFLKDAEEWCERVRAMVPAGYRVLAAWQSERVLAVAGYRVMENLIHGRFLYVDDLVTVQSERRNGLGAALLKELTEVAASEGCQCLVLDSAATNTSAHRFYRREGLQDLVLGFVKPLEAA